MHIFINSIADSRSDTLTIVLSIITGVVLTALLMILIVMICMKKHKVSYTQASPLSFLYAKIHVFLQSYNY